MYYPKVNRGLRFTKPGVYTFGLILAVGMIAIATGINGLYIFLSAGLGGFIVSGILSERAMKFCSVSKVLEHTVAAGEGFSLSFDLANSSKSYAAHAMKTLFLKERPGFRLLAGDIKAEANYYMGTIAPNETLACVAAHEPLQRGFYAKMLVMQQTTFPFGVLEKFKFHELETSLTITPAIDAVYYAEMRDIARRLRTAIEADREFYTHRPFTTRDSLRTLDWKKSAGRKPQHWVAKVYRSTNANGPIIVEADWELCRRAPSSEMYETYLTRVYTACVAMHDEGLDFALEVTPWGQLANFDLIAPMLAKLPRFEELRTRPLWPVPQEFGGSDIGSEVPARLVSAREQRSKRVTRISVGSGQRAVTS